MHSKISWRKAERWVRMGVDGGCSQKALRFNLTASFDVVHDFVQLPGSFINFHVVATSMRLRMLTHCKCIDGKFTMWVPLPTCHLVKSFNIILAFALFVIQLNTNDTPYGKWINAVSESIRATHVQNKQNYVVLNQIMKLFYVGRRCVQ